MCFEILHDPCHVYFHGKISSTIKNFWFIPSFTKFHHCSDQPSKILSQFVKSISFCTNLKKLQTTYQNEALHVYFISGKFHDFWNYLELSKSLYKASAFATVHIKLSRTLDQFVNFITLCKKLQKLQNTYQNKYIYVYFIYENFHDFWTSFD